MLLLLSKLSHCSDVVVAQSADGHVPAHLAECVVLVISSDQLAAAGMTSAFSVAHCYTFL